MSSRAIGLLIGVLFLLPVQGLFGQSQLEQYIRKVGKGPAMNFPSQVQEFYRFNNNAPVWINNSTNRLQLLTAFSQSIELGLEESDYPISLVRKLDSPGVRPGIDSLHAELVITDAAIHFFHDVAYGNEVPGIWYNGLGYAPDCIDIAGSLSVAIAGHHLSSLIHQLQPAENGYHALKKLLNSFTQRAGMNNFKDAKITSLVADSDNQSLITRLWQLGITDSPQVKYSGAAVKEMVRTAQRLFNFQEDGSLNGTLREALNVPLSNRITGLKHALNTVRWLRCMCKIIQSLSLIFLPPTCWFMKKEKFLLNQK